MAQGACGGPDYRGYLVPEKGITKAYSTIEDQKIRNVDANEGTVSIDFKMWCATSVNGDPSTLYAEVESLRDPKLNSYAIVNKLILLSCT